MRCINKLQSSIIRCIIDLDFLPINKGLPFCLTHPYPAPSPFFLMPSACCSSDLPAYSCAAAMVETTPLFAKSYTQGFRALIGKIRKGSLDDGTSQRGEAGTDSNLCYKNVCAVTNPWQFKMQLSVSDWVMSPPSLPFSRCGSMLLLRYSSLWGQGLGSSWLSPATTLSTIIAIGKNCASTSMDLTHCLKKMNVCSRVVGLLH